MAVRDEYLYLSPRVKTETGLAIKKLAAASGVRETHFLGLALVIGCKSLAEQMGLDLPTDRPLFQTVEELT